MKGAKTLCCSGLLWGWAEAQTALGIWSLEELQIRWGPKGRYHALVRTEPRAFLTTWERLMLMGLLGYAPWPKHTFWIGGVSAHFYHPDPFYQDRLQQRWQLRPGKSFSTLVTLEQRWQNFHYVEARLRLSFRYEYPLGKGRLLLFEELHLQDRHKPLHGAIRIRENRLGLYYGRPLPADGEMEVGYLQVIFPDEPLRHRLWVALRFRIENPAKENERKKP